MKTNLSQKWPMQGWLNHTHCKQHLGICSMKTSTSRVQETLHVYWLVRHLCSLQHALLFHPFCCLILDTVRDISRSHLLNVAIKASRCRYQPCTNWGVHAESEVLASSCLCTEELLQSYVNRFLSTHIAILHASGNCLRANHTVFWNLWTVLSRSQLL